MKFSRVNLGLSLPVMILIWSFTGCSLPVIESSNLKNLDSQTLHEVKLTNKIIYFLPKGYIKLKYGTATVEKTLETKNTNSTTETTNSPTKTTAEDTTTTSKTVKTNNQMTAETLYFPDQERYYLLTYYPLPWYKDDVTVTISDKGFLSGINVTSENQAGAIIGKVMEIAKTVIAPPVKLKAKEALKEVEPFEVTIEPDTGKSIDILSNKGEKVGTIVFQPLAIRDFPIDQTINGVCFRPALPCKLTVDLINYEKFTFLVMLPNWSPVVSIDITRGLGEKIQQLKFTEGMLTEIHWKKTSSDLLAILSIPAETAKGLAGLPLDLFKIQVQSGK